MPNDKVVPASSKFCPHSPLVPEIVGNQPTGRFGRMSCDPFACEIADSCRGSSSPKARMEQEAKLIGILLDKLTLLEDRLDHFEERLEAGIAAIRSFAPKLKDLPVVGASISRLFGA